MVQPVDAPAPLADNRNRDGLPVAAVAATVSPAAPENEVPRSSLGRVMWQKLKEYDYMRILSLAKRYGKPLLTILERLLVASVVIILSVSQKVDFWEDLSSLFVIRYHSRSLS